VKGVMGGVDEFVTVGERRLTCLFCGADRFIRRSLALNMTGLSTAMFASKGTAAVCSECGFVHQFMRHDVVSVRADAAEEPT
jgi:hypothetical protein